MSHLTMTFSALQEFSMAPQCHHSHQVPHICTTALNRLHSKPTDSPDVSPRKLLQEPLCCALHFLSPQSFGHFCLPFSAPEVLLIHPSRLSICRFLGKPFLAVPSMHFAHTSTGALLASSWSAPSRLPAPWGSNVPDPSVNTHRAKHC